MSCRSHSSVLAPIRCPLASVGCHGGSLTLSPGAAEWREAGIMRSKWNRRPITALVGATALLLSGLAATTTIALTATPAAAASAPTSATDETKIPHYFGPSPNWANSPLTMATADVKSAEADTGR